MNVNEFSLEHVDIPLRCSIIPSADFLDYHENGENIKAKSTEEENMIKKIIDLKRWDTENPAVWYQEILFQGEHYKDAISLASFVDFYLQVQST